MDSLEKSVIITGANTGLGYYCAKSIAAQNKSCHVVLACRDKNKGEEAVQKMIAETGNPHVTFLLLDLASFASVKEFVQIFLQKNYPPLKGIICNAGLAGEDIATYTQDGIETTFQVNCLSHFLLIHLLHKHLSRPARILMVSSELHRNDGPMKAFLPNYISARELAHPNKQTVNAKGKGSMRYSTSKLCMLMYTHQFSELFKTKASNEITINAFNPGLMPDTGLGGLNKKILRKLFLKYILPLFVKGTVSTPQQSGQWLAELFTSDKFAGMSGKYFDRNQQIEPSKESHDQSKINDLWLTSIQLTNIQNEL